MIMSGKINTNYRTIQEDNTDHRNHAQINTRVVISNQETNDRLRNMLTVFVNTRIRYSLIPRSTKLNVDYFMLFVTGALDRKCITFHVDNYRRTALTGAHDCSCIRFHIAIYRRTCFTGALVFTGAHVIYMIVVNDLLLVHLL